MAFGRTFQDLINSGQAWRLEGHIGRQCMDAIDNGYAICPPEPDKDYWGNQIPARYMLVPGTKGTIEYANDQREARGEEPVTEADFDNNTIPEYDDGESLYDM